MSKNNAGSASQYFFSQVPQANIPRCRIRRPQTHKTTFDAGKLIPFYVDEVIPGDTHKIDLSAFCRMTTQVVPTMDNLYMDFHFYFVPYRLLWEHWEAMHGDRPNPGDSIDYSCPFIPGVDGGVSAGSLADYFGLPLGVKWGDHDVNAFAFRAYNLVWNEWYRDENLQDRAPQHKGDDGDTLADYQLLPRNKRKDYFTSALPWPQKGDTVELPIGATAPLVGGVDVYGNGQTLGWAFGTDSGFATYGTKYNTGGYGLLQTQSLPSESYPIGKPGVSANLSAGNDKTVGLTPDKSMSGVTGSFKDGSYADLSRATAATVNDLREAFQIQRLLERDARGGTRYRELLRAHYGVVSPDARLQVPELLGTCTLTCAIQQIAQTSATAVGTTEQGNLSAIGTFSGVKRGIVQKSFTEWGLILGLVSVRSDLTYQQGIPRVFSKSTRYDYYYPALAHLGEQAILNKEIYAQDYTVTDDDGESINDKTFGYQERWSEYKFGLNKITGELRSTAPASLDVWHLAQRFDNLPTLSTDFIVEDPPLERLLAVQDTPAFIFDSLVDVESVRPLPLYDVPGLIDHF